MGFSYRGYNVNINADTQYEAYAALYRSGFARDHASKAEVKKRLLSISNQLPIGAEVKIEKIYHPARGYEPNAKFRSGESAEEETLRLVEHGAFYNPATGKPKDPKWVRVSRFRREAGGRTPWVAFEEAAEDYGHHLYEDHPQPVDDPFYVIQGLYRDGHVSIEFGFDDEEIAIDEAKKLSRAPHFEGDYVRIITRDGELVWDSRGGDPSGRGTWLLPPGMNEARSGVLTRNEQVVLAAIARASAGRADYDVRTTRIGTDRAIGGVYASLSKKRLIRTSWDPWGGGVPGAWVALTPEGAAALPHRRVQERRRR